jgi:NADH dehydrogenase
MVLVVGSTGRLGSEICRRLAAAGKPVRALVRATSDPAKVDQLRELGAEIVEGDLHDRASLDAACQEVTAVISTVSSMPFSYDPETNNIQTVDVDGVTNLIRAAADAGVNHFIYTSFSGQIELDCPLENAKRTVEGRLRESGLTHTILRPSYFMESWLSPAVGFSYPEAKATIYGSGEKPISWISLGDVAEFAFQSLDNPAARNAVLEMGGPEALTPLEVVSIFEVIGGRPFEVQHVPEEALAAQQAGTTDGMQQSFAALMQCYAKGDAIPMEETLELFDIQPTSVRDYAESVLGTA